MRYSYSDKEHIKHNTKHDNIEHDDIEYNNIEHNDIKHNNIEHPAIRNLSEEEIANIYKTRMVRDFPQDELIPLNIILMVNREGCYPCFGLYESGLLRGYCFIMRVEIPDAVYLIDYISIIPEYRDKGYGTLFQKMLFEHMSDAEIVLCEVEDPDTAPEKNSRDNMLRRIRHYSKVGWTDTGVRVNTFGVDYRLMEYPLGKKHDAEDVKKYYWGLYSGRLPKEKLKTIIFRHCADI